MKNAPANRPTHIVQGNVFDALGFSASEASALKVKAELHSAILEHVRSKAYTQAQLAKILDEYQPAVSNLLRGRITQVSIEKLLRYADRLHLETRISIRPFPARKEGTTSRHRRATRLAATG
jgi:predicted XRE-type DNA-binding protein